MATFCQALTLEFNACHQGKYDNAAECGQIQGQNAESGLWRSHGSSCQRLPESLSHQIYVQLLTVPDEPQIDCMTV